MLTMDLGRRGWRRRSIGCNYAGNGGVCPWHGPTNDSAVPEEHFHYAWSLGEADGRGSFAKRKGAADEGAGIDFARPQESKGLVERAATGADDGKLLHYRRPSL